MRLRKKFEVVVFSLVVVFSFVLFLGSQYHWDLEEEMKPYLFLSGLLLGTSISILDLIAFLLICFLRHHRGMEGKEVVWMRAMSFKESVLHSNSPKRFVQTARIFFQNLVNLRKKLLCRSLVFSYLICWQLLVMRMSAFGTKRTLNLGRRESNCRL